MTAFTERQLIIYEYRDVSIYWRNNKIIWQEVNALAKEGWEVIHWRTDTAPWLAILRRAIIPDTNAHHLD